MPRSRRFSRPRFRQPMTLCTDAGPLDVLLVRSPRRRTIEIAVGEDAAVRVSAPTSSAMRDIEAFIHQKAEWIRQRVTEAHGRCRQIDRRQYDDGEEFLFLGQRYRLSVREGAVKQPRLSFSDAGWEILVSAGETPESRRRKVRKTLIDWYRAQAKEVLPGRLFHYARGMALEPKKIAVRTQKRIWGSCGIREKSISLNWMLVLAPMATIDYVVVHELSHLVVPNHSARFWRKVAGVLPDYKERQAWLKQHALEMALPER